MSDNYDIMPEHAAVEKQGTPTEQYDPTPEEQQELKVVRKLFSDAKRFKDQYSYKWLDWYKMFRGKQWKEQRPTYRHSEVLNLLFQTIQSQVPILTDTRPKFEFMPQEPGDYELAEILNEVAQADWIKKNWMYQLTEILYEGYLYGTGISCLKFDPDKNTIVYDSADPFYSFPDPCAKDVNDRSRYFIYAEPMAIAEIKRKWPETGKYVKPDLIDIMQGNKTDIGPMRYKSPTDSRTFVESDGGYMSDYQEKDKALVMHTWMQCDEYEEVLEEFADPHTGDISSVTKHQLKFPNGKVIVVASGVVLSSGQNPYEHAEFPYQRWQNYILPREFWGVSECEPLEGPQKTFNKIISFVLDTLTLMGNPIWVVDNTAGVDTDNLVNRPGVVIEKEPGSTVQRVEGVQLQPYIMALIDKYKEWFDQIAGSNDVTRGLNPTGVTAASAIESLQNAAQTRIRQKSRNLDCYLQQLGQQYLSLAFQFYTAPQIFRITGKDGANKYFKFHTDPEKQVAYVEHFSPEGLSMGINEYQMRGKFDVRVTTGSSLPFSKSEKEQRMLNLFDRGIVDAQEVLKALDYPNYEALLKRIEDKQAQAAAQQQAPMQKAS
jgi:hypothetical protein